jgi:hypothetical protein
MGLFKVTPTGWGTIARARADLDPVARDRLDVTALLARLLRQEVRIDTVPVSGRFFEVDREADLALYERWLLEKTDRAKEEDR